MTRVLIVDDEETTRTILRVSLAGEGFEIDEAEDSAGTWEALRRNPVDLVILDLQLGREDGVSLARAIRQELGLPIIMLTAKSDVIDRVIGLEAGADDYVTKPFHVIEVLARIRSVLRRRQSSGSAAPASEGAAPSAVPARLAFDGWQVDLTRRTVHNPKGEPVALTTREFDLLIAFCKMPNRTVSREELMELVKGREWATHGRTIDTQVACLRRKIEKDPANPILIKTVHGRGYLFTVTVGTAA